MSYADARRFKIIIIVSRKDCNSQFISLGCWTILRFGDRILNNHDKMKKKDYIECVRKKETKSARKSIDIMFFDVFFLFCLFRWKKEIMVVGSLTLSHKICSKMRKKPIILLNIDKCAHKLCSLPCSFFRFFSSSSYSSFHLRRDPWSILCWYRHCSLVLIHFSTFSLFRALAI